MLDSELVFVYFLLFVSFVVSTSAVYWL